MWPLKLVWSGLGSWIQRWHFYFFISLKLPAAGPCNCELVAAELMVSATGIALFLTVTSTHTASRPGRHYYFPPVHSQVLFTHWLNPRECLTPMWGGGHKASVGLDQKYHCTLPQKQYALTEAAMDLVYKVIFYLIVSNSSVPCRWHESLVFVSNVKEEVS